MIKNVMEKYRKPLTAAALCLLLVLALSVAGAAALSAGRRQPETPQPQTYPGLNIEQIGLRYDQQAQTQDTAAGDGEGDGQTQQEDPQQDEEQPPQETAKSDQITVEDPEQEPQEPTEEPGDAPSDEGPADEDMTDDQPQEPQIATSLRANMTIAQEELTDDLFAFFAQILNGDDDTYLRVRIKNSETNGKWLTASGDTYTSKLALGRNEITILMKRGAEVIGEVTRVINYRAEMATEEEPEKGSAPPTIRTNLSDDTIETTNRNMTLTVWAADGEGNAIHQNHIRVELDGREITQYTGSGANGLEYALSLTAGNIGSRTEHTVKILAWDDKGNSTLKTYKIIYKTRDSGEKIGTATVRVDLSVLGMGLVDIPVDCDVLQDVPASYAVKEALESLGYTISYDGSLDNGFYLTRIRRSMSFKYAEIPEELRTLLELDGLSVSRPSGYKNSVGEFDYTMGSGWMYSINGVYPGKGLSEYYLSDGDTLTIRFTLAYGKDIGGSSGGAQNGVLREYCGRWVDGQYTARHTYHDGVCSVCGAVDPDSHVHQETETVTRPATCTEAGEKTLTCSLCGQSHTEEIPAAGHSYAFDCQPVEGGYTVTAHCTVCGQSHSETVASDRVETVSRTEPTCTEAGSITRRVTVVIDGQSITTETTSVLDRLPHTYDEAGICSGCGESDPAHEGEQETEYDETEDEA